MAIDERLAERVRDALREIRAIVAAKVIGARNSNPACAARAERRALGRFAQRTPARPRVT
jgi:hypothetical protein